MTLSRALSLLVCFGLAGCGAGSTKPQAQGPGRDGPHPTRPGVVFWPVRSPDADPKAIEFGHPPDCGCAGDKRLGVSVLLPKGYDGHRRFPVLYLMHGAGEAHDTFLTRPTAKNGMLGGDIRRLARNYPAIIVMPEGGAFGWYTNWWKSGPAWERYHLDEVIPLVERRLRVKPGRRNHAIAGWSMGGLGALFYASQRPGYFGAAESLSGRIAIQLPSFQKSLPSNDQRRTSVWGDPVAQAFYWAGHDPATLAANLRATRVFVRVGDGAAAGADRDSNEAVTERGLLDQAKEFTARARTAGVPVSMQVVHGLHNAFNERSGLADALHHLTFGEVPATPTSWTYRTVAQTGKAWGVHFRFAAQPDRLITLRRDRSQLTIDGSGGSVELDLPGRAPVRDRLPLLISF